MGDRKESSRELSRDKWARPVGGDESPVVKARYKVCELGRVGGRG